MDKLKKLHLYFKYFFIKHALVAANASFKRDRRFDFAHKNGCLAVQFETTQNQHKLILF